MNHPQKTRRGNRPVGYRMVLALGLCLGLVAGAVPAGAALTGDADCSGTVNARDALAILQADVGLLPVSFLCASSADVSHDGRINVVDAELVLQFSAGVIDHL